MPSLIAAEAFPDSSVDKTLVDEGYAACAQSCTCTVHIGAHSAEFDSGADAGFRSVVVVRASGS